MNNYVVSRVPEDKIMFDKDRKPVWYCHMKGFPNIPVFGSIGSKQKALAVCKQMNMKKGS